MGNRSPLHNKTPHNGTINYDTVFDHGKNHKINVKRDYRIPKSNKKINQSSEECQVDGRVLKGEYLSNAQRFVERNKAVIDSGTMFHMKPISKPHLRFINILYVVCEFIVCLSSFVYFIL